MPYLLLKEVPRYECLQAAAARVPGADPAICQLFLNILHTGTWSLKGRRLFLRGMDLNQARLIVLVLLDNSENGSMRSSELAEHASVSRATITGLLDTLEKAGFVERTDDVRDRRAFVCEDHFEGACASPQSAATFGPLDGGHTFGVERPGAEPAGGALTKNSKGFLRAVRPFQFMKKAVLIVLAFLAGLAIVFALGGIKFFQVRKAIAEYANFCSAA